MGNQEAFTNVLFEMDSDVSQILLDRIPQRRFTFCLQLRCWKCLHGAVGHVKKALGALDSIPQLPRRSKETHDIWESLLEG